MNILAFDTETHLIADRTAARHASGEGRKGRVLTSPWVYPTVVLGTTASPAMPNGSIYTPVQLKEVLISHLAVGGELVGQNLPFDIGVMIKAFPELREPFMRAADEGRLHDTKVLDNLYGLAIGRYDIPRYNAETKVWSEEDLKPRSLEKLAFDYCGIVLDKDPNVRLGFGQFENRVHELPEQFKMYAIQDAVATLRVYQEIMRRLEKMNVKGNLSEATQIRAELVLHNMDTWGVGIDKTLAAKLREHYSKDIPMFQEQMVAGGVGRWKPEPKSAAPLEKVEGVPCDGEWHRAGHDLVRGKQLKTKQKWEYAKPDFSISTEGLQTALAALPAAARAPKRADGTLSLEGDFWEPVIPEESVPLQAWLKHAKLQKIITTYLDVYAETDRIFPKWWNLGAKTGRMSASCPSVQNVPKRKYGIRALFVPAPGHVFTKADYSAQELFTLTEVLHHMGITGALAQTLMSGVDPHRYAASLVLRKDIKDVTTDERQGQKALNFGVPGGLGPQKLAEYAFGLYGIRWTKEEAAQRRTQFLDAFPDIDEYLMRIKRSQDTILQEVTGMSREQCAESYDITDWNVIKAMTQHENPEVRQLGILAERHLTVELPNGFMRAKCRFTEAANTGFQGLGAAVTKEAAWNAFRAGLRPVLIVHDEIVIEHAVTSTGSDVLLEDCMLQAFRKVCPFIGEYAKVEVTSGIKSWGPATAHDGTVLVL